MTRIWCNGQWLDPGDFTVAPADRGLTHGLGLFETVLAVDGSPLFAQRHLNRLRSACLRLGWDIQLPDLRETMIALLQANGLTRGRARIRVALTAGSGRIQDLALGADHMLWMSAAPAAEIPPATSANLSPWRRNEHSPLAGLKCASYAENLVALAHATHLGFEETLFLNTAGQLCEAATSNVFLVTNGALCTPALDSGCLDGITRGIVFELAAQLGIACQEADLTTQDLQAADEVFLTSSIRGVIAVARLETHDLPIGPVTAALREAWTAVVLQSSALLVDVLH